MKNLKLLKLVLTKRTKNQKLVILKKISQIHLMVSSTPFQTKMIKIGPIKRICKITVVIDAPMQKKTAKKISRKTPKHSDKLHHLLSDTMTIEEEEEEEQGEVVDEMMIKAVVVATKDEGEIRASHKVEITGIEVVDIEIMKKVMSKEREVEVVIRIGDVVAMKIEEAILTETNMDKVGIEVMVVDMVVANEEEEAIRKSRMSTIAEEVMKI